ncbi:MAG TPA: SDR family oxidoreductase [Candidatus Kapabacteria bacterium]|nr:SDR family oxidoreductase [Candidatus Kapabacteria bacterium]
MTKNMYALILGASSGFGRASALELAKNGYNIIGVHLDMGSNRLKAEELRKEIENLGVEVTFYNSNAADDGARNSIIEELKSKFNDGESNQIRVVLHSLAFGALKPLFAKDPKDTCNRKQVEMTMDVMANSLVYWVQDLFTNNLLANNSRIFAMSSIGSMRAMANYGAVSAAKCALEAYVRQIAIELGQYKITANTILAGMTDTPASNKIPAFAGMLVRAKDMIPFGRNTLPEDVAKIVLKLSDPDFYWITGQTIAVDGGESILNFVESK